MPILNESNTVSMLTRIMGNIKNPQQWVSPLLQALPRYKINTPMRQAHFLAQVAHESGEFNTLEENLSYTAVRLMSVWPKRFPSVSSAQPYERNPEKLANFVYGGRMGNGPPESGDGWRFRGRGLIMLTGKSNYVSASSETGFDLIAYPDLLSKPNAACHVAAWFFSSRGCNELADDITGDNDKEDFERITQLINGGLIGLEHRRIYLNKAIAAMV